VHRFTLDPNIGAYVLHSENIRMPESGKTYSVNEAYRDSFPSGIQEYLQWTKGQDYSLRYVGSLVADFHRTLLRGGVFLYPPTAEQPQGKLRLLYEANPLAMIAEQAGGMAVDMKDRILAKQPRALHERTPLIIGSHSEVQRVVEFVG
jgi:fructose-1,6-bisphosphatase I